MIVKQDVIVKSETHTKITCKCPECGEVFDAWLQKHLVANPVNRNMEEETTDCTFCHEEWLARDEEENEPSFGGE